MPLYDYACPRCETRHEQRFTFNEYAQKPQLTCPTCGFAPLVRRMPRSFSVVKSMPEHFNPTLGRHVTSSRDFKNGLKRASDEATARTGIPHNFEPVNLADKESLGVTDEGLDSTYNAAVATGEIQRGNAGRF